MESNKRFYSEYSSKTLNKRHRKHFGVNRSLSLDSSKESREKKIYDTYKKELIDQRKRELLVGKTKLPAISNETSLHRLESVKEEREMSRSQSSAEPESRGGSPDRKRVQAAMAVKIVSSQFKRLLSRKANTAKLLKRHTYPKLYHSYSYRDAHRKDISFKSIARTVIITLRWYRLHNFRWDIGV